MEATSSVDGWQTRKDGWEGALYVDSVCVCLGERNEGGLKGRGWGEEALG